MKATIRRQLRLFVVALLLFCSLFFAGAAYAFESSNIEEKALANEPQSFKSSNGEEDVQLFEAPREKDERQTLEPVYSVHVQGIGWMPSASSGATAGTTGRSKRVEALKAELKDSDGDIAPVFIQAHVAGIGWQDWIDSSSHYAGTTGQSRAIEALRIKLPDDVAQTYSIWYRVHSEKYGWLDWACDGASAGTVGYGYRIEAIEIRLLSKGGAAPGDVERPFANRVDDPPVLSYKGHVSKIGWQTTVGDGITAGTTGCSLALEALNASVSWYGHSGSLELRSHVSNDGWQSWKTGTTGTTGKSKKIEAIQLRLTGELGERYDVWYRVHVSSLGWMGWTSNGNVAGTTDASRFVEAIQIVLLPKDSPAPGDTNGAYKGPFERLKGDVKRLDNTGASFGKSEEIVLGKEDGPRLSSIRLSVDNKITEGDISYKVLSQYAGAQDWTAEGQYAGISGDVLKGVAFQLSGPLAEVYDVWYQVCDSEDGWLGWASNGADAGSVGSSSYISAVKVVLLEKGMSAPGSTENAFVNQVLGEPHLIMQGHSAKNGWGVPTLDGSTLGTTGKSLSLQAFRIVTAGPISGDVQLSSHVSGLGWQDWVNAGAISGTVGKSLPIEAVRLKLTGDLASQYSIFYRVHSAQYGWLGWAKDGEEAGTTGLSLQMEAIEVRLVKRDSSDAPVSDKPAQIVKPTLSSQAHVSTEGWLDPVDNAKIVGTTGKGLKLESYILSLDSQLGGSIVYQSHVQGIGWQQEVSDGAVSGTVGENRRIEAVKIHLTGELSQYFDVWYRAHVQTYGWMGWAKNGAPAGTSKIGYRLEAVEIRLLPKGSKAPGLTSRAYSETPPLPPDRLAMLSKANGYSSNTMWLLMVNTRTCRVGVYRGARGAWQEYAYWQCSPGAPSTPTVLGQFTVKGKGYVFGRGYSCYYYTQFYGDYLFHSILYYQGTFQIQDGRLGQNLSHGCVRLSLQNAKWIYDNIPYGTKVVTYR